MAEEKAPKPNQPLKSEALFEPADSRLTITTELLPVSEMAHHQLAVLLTNPSTFVDCEQRDGKLVVTLLLEHTENIALKGKEQHDIHVAARDAGLAVPEYLARKAAKEKAAQ